MLPPNLPRYPSPAKLNLDLRIIGKRADGYHLLESIFTLINLQDTLCIQARNDNQINLHTPTPNVPPEQDLTVRAVHALRQATACTKGADIWLEKNIPMGAGLGGGSSNASTVLMVLNHLWQCQLNTQQLIDIGVKLGADVPFFIFGQTAFAQGIGEQLQAIAVPQQHYVVVRPNVHVATPKIFAHPDLPRNSPSHPNPTYANLHPLRNDMQAVVLAEYPPIAEAYRLLNQYGETRLTGSGACLFLTCDSVEQAEHIRAQLPPTLQSWCVQSLAEHPIRSIL